MSLGSSVVMFSKRWPSFVLARLLSGGKKSTQSVNGLCSHKSPSELSLKSAPIGDNPEANVGFFFDDLERGSRSEAGSRKSRAILGLVQMLCRDESMPGT